MVDEAERIPAAVWPLAAFLAEEMQARKWTYADVAERMSGDYFLNVLLVNVTLAIHKDNLIFTDELARELASAFDVSADYLLNLDAQWRRWPQSRQAWICPEELLGGFAVQKEAV